MDIIQVLSFSIGLSILVSVVLFIKKGQLQEKYSIIWLAAAIIICALSMSRNVLETLSELAGIHYPPSLLFLVGVLFLLAINIGFSIQISKYSRKIDLLAQELTLLKHKIETQNKDEPIKKN